jgi:hypothetical protein
MRVGNEMNDTFASKSLTEHLLRGAIGFGSIFAAFELMSKGDLFAVLAALCLLVVALFAFRGCPMCWTVGLFNTSFRTLYKAKSCRACDDITQRPAKT